MKRDKDDTDFRGIAGSYQDREQGCTFCELGKAERIVAENELSYAIRDLYPVTEHHTLVFPKRHEPDFFNLHQPEINAIHSLLDKVKREIESLDSSVTGFNIAVNNGQDAGQMIFHCHIHIIPRRKGDTGNPRGGVRCALPSKQKYPS